MSACDNCKIRLECNFLSDWCRLTAREIARTRPDLVKPGARLSKETRYYRSEKGQARKVKNRDHGARLARDRYKLNRESINTRRRKRYKERAAVN